jgi:hypothetical protein
MIAEVKVLINTMPSLEIDNQFEIPVALFLSRDLNAIICLIKSFGEH